MLILELYLDGTLMEVVGKPLDVPDYLYTSAALRRAREAPAQTDRHEVHRGSGSGTLYQKREKSGRSGFTRTEYPGG